MALQPAPTWSLDQTSRDMLLAIEDDKGFIDLLMALADNPHHSPAILFEGWALERLERIKHANAPIYTGEFLRQLDRLLPRHGRRDVEQRLAQVVKAHHGKIFQGQTLETLLTTYYPEPQWAVHGLVPEGCHILAGKPKQGKSYLALTLALAVAKHQTCLDHFPVTPGDVLCFSLEDYAKRVQRRMEKLYTQRIDDHTIEFFYHAPKMGEGFGEQLANTLNARPAVRLVIIDTLRCIRDNTGEQYNLYQEDSDFMGKLNQCAQDAGIAIVVLHHTRKAKSDDVFDEITGTGGLRGGTSANMVLEESTGDADALLHIEGKDFDRRMHIALKRLDTGAWTFVGEGEVYQVRSQKRAVMQAIGLLGDDARAKDIWQESKIDKYGTVKSILSRMASLGEIGKSQNGVYFLIDSFDTGVDI